MPLGDGVSLVSACHPKLPWYRRLWARRPRLAASALETIGVSMPPVACPCVARGYIHRIYPGDGTSRIATYAECMASRDFQPHEDP